MKLMTQCNEKGFELEVSTPICVTLFPMQHLMGLFTLFTEVLH